MRAKFKQKWAKQIKLLIKYVKTVCFASNTARAQINIMYKIN